MVFATGQPWLCDAELVAGVGWGALADVVSICEMLGKALIMFGASPALEFLIGSGSRNLHCASGQFRPIWVTVVTSRERSYTLKKAKQKRTLVKMPASVFRAKPLLC